MLVRIITSLSSCKVSVNISSVKKIRLKSAQSDKIFREVNALSRLSHRNIVRYYTTWVETAEPDAHVASDDSSIESGTDDTAADRLFGSGLNGI